MKRELLDISTGVSANLTEIEEAIGTLADYKYLTFVSLICQQHLDLGSVPNVDDKPSFMSGVAYALNLIDDILIESAKKDE